METENVCGWTVEWSAPTLRIRDDRGDVVFESDDWNPNMADPREDALAWAGAVADPDSGLTVEFDDDPEFGRMVRHVREHAPESFADECALLSEHAQ